MGYQFVKNGTGGADDGSTMDDAWETLEAALEATPSAGDVIIVRRGHSEIPTTDIAVTGDGTAADPIKVIGFPRAAHSISSADFVNGSTAVVVDDADMDREKHQGRFLTGPDGFDYLITRVVDASNIVIDRPYAGSTASNEAVSIKEDEDYDLLTYSATFQGEADDDKLTVASHPYKTGDGPVFVHEGTTLPTGLAEDTEYWVIYDSATTIKLASSKALALAGTAINLTGDGTADNTIQTINDFDWTIKLTDYKADADDLPLIDFNETAYQIIQAGDDYFHYKNLDLKDSDDTDGVFEVSGSPLLSFTGCLFSAVSGLNHEIIRSSAMGCVQFDRCIIEGGGNSGDTLQYAIQGVSSRIVMNNCAIYNLGNFGLHISGCQVFLNNVNIGVEVANQDDDIYIINGGVFFGIDTNLGGSNGYVSIIEGADGTFVKIENNGKSLGAHKTWYPGGTFEKSTALTTETTPAKKVSDYVLKISPNVSGYQFVPDYAVEIFCHEFVATTDSLTYKYWLYNNTGDILNSGDAKGSIWLELQYINSYGDAVTEYTQVKSYSTEKDIADAADDDDWDYLQVATIAPAVASRVRIRCFCRHYTAAGDIYIDPAVVIS